MLFRLSAKSLWHRKGSVIMTLVATSLSIFVMLGVEHLRVQAKASFSQTISGTDLIVGARTSQVNLLLYAVFRIGSPTNNIGWNSYQHFKQRPEVDWTIPLSLGDSHRNYRVLGTDESYFKHYRYGKHQRLSLNQGRIFNTPLDVVLGSEVAEALQYHLGDQLILSHGIASSGFANHEEHPFEVVGILNPTGTAVDQTLHVSLAGIEAIHRNWQVTSLPSAAAGSQPTNRASNQVNHAAGIDDLSNVDLTPSSITAFLVGLKSPMHSFRLQRHINDYPYEPLLAILPGVSLSELWQITGTLETTLTVISILVLFAAFIGMSAMLLASLRERRQEIHLLRIMGAPPSWLFLLIQMEALLIALCSLMLGAGGLILGLTLLSDTLSTRFGLFIDNNVLTARIWMQAGWVLLITAVLAAIPSFSLYLKER